MLKLLSIELKNWQTHPVLQVFTKFRIHGRPPYSNVKISIEKTSTSCKPLSLRMRLLPIHEIHLSTSIRPINILTCNISSLSVSSRQASVILALASFTISNSACSRAMLDLNSLKKKRKSLDHHITLGPWGDRSQPILDEDSFEKIKLEDTWRWHEHRPWLIINLMS